MPGRSTAILCAAIACAFTAFFWRQGERFLDANGPTFDECVHLAAGHSYWTAGDFRMNNEDPPLLKLWWALPLVVDPPADWHPTHSEGNHWQAGIEFLYHSGVPHQEPLRPARRMNLLFGSGIVLLAGWWARRLWQSWLAGITACGFAACDPNLLAISCVLSTDAGFALFALLSSYLLWEYAANPNRVLLLATGVSLGLMLAAKLSAIAMIGGFAAAGCVYLLRGGVLALPEAAPVRLRRAAKLRLAVDLVFRLLVIALIVLAATYGFVHFDEWGRGLKFQFTRAEHGDGRFFLDGAISKTGWLHYFLVVMAVKLPLGLLAAAALAFLRSRASVPCFFAVPPIVFFAAASVARVDLGIRVVLPAIAFLYVLAGGLSAPGAWRCLRMAMLGACLAWAGYAAATEGSDPIAYFNELGKSQPNLVADSNVDWGQGLPRLREYMQRERLDAVYLSYFGTDRPEAYGIRFQALPGYGRVGPPGGEAIPRDAPRHVVAISINNLLGIYLNDPATFAFLRSRPPTAMLGGSVAIYDLTGDDAAIDRLRSGNPVAIRQ
ncbi:MAG TPA: phospholipid carrier-dependent glycosyltransferase [Gemmataceae bacterium]